MPRRGQQKRNQARRARVEAIRQLESEHGRFVPPDRGDCEERDWYYFDETWTIRIEYRLWRYNGRIADFSVVLKALSADAMEEVERIDCCHGHCHIHQRNEVVATLGRIDIIEDVDRAFYVIDRVVEDRIRILLSGREKQ